MFYRIKINILCTKGKKLDFSRFVELSDKNILEKKYFDIKILITKIHNNIIKRDTIFPLLAPLDRNRENHRE